MKLDIIFLLNLCERNFVRIKFRLRKKIARVSKLTAALFNGSIITFV